MTITARRLVGPAALCLIVACAVAASWPAPQSKEAPGAAANFEVQKLAEGVYAAIRTEPPSLMVDANNVFIINDDDVVVVDANVTPGSTRQVLAALRKLTPKPVKYVINTHWHDDHIMGNQVYRDAFPGVEFIAHANTREYLPAQGLVNRNKMIANVPGYISLLKGQLEKNQSLAGGVLTDEERTSYASDIDILERYHAENPGAKIVLPTVALEDRLTLYRGGRIIDIRYLGRGHTSGDIVVHLPKEGILCAGDLVISPIPLVGSDQSHVGDWAATLEKLRALRPSVIVPGHGHVVRDDSYMKLQASLFASIKQQTEAAVARGETLEQAQKSVNLEEFRKTMAGDDKVLNLLFSNYVAGPGVASAFHDAAAKP